jgi:DNA replication protein DnaC
MSATDDLVPLLKKLRLSGVLASLAVRTQQATDDNLSHVEFLYRVLSDEVERRDAKQLDVRVRRAGFEALKTVEDFDWHFNPEVPKAKILDLCSCAFVQRHDNVLFVGQAGVGKSHLAQALGHRACLAGHSVLYTGAHEMLTQLRAARADNSYERKLLRFTTPDVLIVDDVGLRPLGLDEPVDLFEVIRQRYERGSLILTSNRDLDEWPPLFGNPLLASAAMDRLLHHAHVVVIREGDSYRNPPPAKRAQRGAAKPQQASREAA